MATTENTYTGNGSTTNYSFTFPYLSESDVKVSLDDVDQPTTAYSFANATTISFVTAPANGVAIRIYRQTAQDTPPATFFAGSAIRAQDLNDNFLQTLYVAQETDNIARNLTAGDIAPGSITNSLLDDNSVTSSKIVDGTIVNADISASAEIAVSKLADGNARQLLQTDAAGTGVEWTSNVDVPGTLDVTGVATFDSTVTATGAATFSSTVTATGAATFNNTVTATGNVTVPSLNGGPLAGMRNAIINGDFDIWQRGTTFTTNTYGADRWLHGNVGTTHTVTRELFTIGQTDVPNEPSYFCRTVVSSVSGTGNSSFLIQKIEGVRTFAGQQVTLSFWAKADASKPIAVELAQFFGTGGSPTPSATVESIGVTKTTLSTSWQKITVTATVPSISAKTIGTNGDDCLSLVIWFDAGSSFNARTDSLGQQSGTFDIAQVQVERGPNATPFERRSYGLELALCQRYYLSATTSATLNVSGYTANVSYVGNFPVTMRIVPNIAGVTASFKNENNFTAYANIAGSSWAGNVAFTANAEL